jgi:hypothetical protein
VYIYIYIYIYILLKHCLNDTAWGEPKHWERNQPEIHYVYSKYHMNFTEMPKTNRLNYGIALKHKLVSIIGVYSLSSSAQNISHLHCNNKLPHGVWKIMAVDSKNHTRRVNTMCGLYIKFKHVPTRDLHVLYTGTRMSYNPYASKT